MHTHPGIALSLPLWNVWSHVFPATILALIDPEWSQLLTLYIFECYHVVDIPDIGWDLCIPHYFGLLLLGCLWLWPSWFGSN